MTNTDANKTSTPLVNNSQITGAIDRVVLMGLTYAAGKGWITTTDIANYLALIVGILGSGYAFYVNRNTNLAKQAASVPGTTVVTTPEIAAATPNQTNIISTSETKSTIASVVEQNKVT